MKHLQKALAATSLECTNIFNVLRTDTLVNGSRNVEILNVYFSIIINHHTHLNLYTRQIFAVVLHIQMMENLRRKKAITVKEF